MDEQRKPTILYVDDEKINLILFKIIYGLDFNTIIAESGSEGLDILEKRKDIDFVISDMKMPQMNGLEFIKKLKEKKPNLPCIILSGYQRSTEIDTVIKENIINDYFVKPFDKIELRKFIIDVIKNEQ